MPPCRKSSTPVAKRCGTSGKQRAAVPGTRPAGVPACFAGTRAARCVRGGRASTLPAAPGPGAAAPAARYSPSPRPAKLPQGALTAARATPPICLPAHPLPFFFRKVAACPRAVAPPPGPQPPRAPSLPAEENR
ncbi:sterile alpha motif domain-containing protein 1-like [Schistocerca nitens]|uniref:sterile alpha motif domain-containing protein 1-like n=1 Tax=Schistocerca nitens TaxID=7011 RepID=UPI0021197570|nr:sterile alpha motif domain-containing protein 1-like [Schistocerca nitens]